MSDVIDNQQAAGINGAFYIDCLDRLHRAMKPETYLEIGVMEGNSLKLSRSRSIAIDPLFNLAPAYVGAVLNKPELMMFQTTSDAFFARHDPKLFFGQPIDMAFLDGLHNCEYLLRDFINVEKSAKRDGIIVLHDCLPMESGITTRDQAKTSSRVPERQGWWAGDVWRTSLLLRRHRPDLKMTVLDSAPTGLVVISNLDPGSRQLSEQYEDMVSEMLSWDLDAIGVGNLFAEMGIQGTSVLEDEETIVQHVTA